MNMFFTCKCTLYMYTTLIDLSLVNTCTHIFVVPLYLIIKDIIYELNVHVHVYMQWLKIIKNKIIHEYVTYITHESFCTIFFKWQKSKTKTKPYTVVFRNKP